MCMYMCIKPAAQMKETRWTFSNGNDDDSSSYINCIFQMKNDEEEVSTKNRKKKRSKTRIEKRFQMHYKRNETRNEKNVFS